MTFPVTPRGRMDRESGLPSGYRWAAGIYYAAANLRDALVEKATDIAVGGKVEYCKSA